MSDGINSISHHDLPWSKNSPATGVHIRNILHNELAKRLEDGRGTHAETLMTAIGAIVGYAALNAALHKAAEFTSRGEPLGNGLVVKRGKDGQYFFMGDWPNFYLFPNGFSVFVVFSVSVFSESSVYFVSFVSSIFSVYSHIGVKNE